MSRMFAEMHARNCRHIRQYRVFDLNKEVETGRKRTLKLTILDLCLRLGK